MPIPLTLDRLHYLLFLYLYRLYIWLYCKIDKMTVMIFIAGLIVSRQVPVMCVADARVVTLDSFFSPFRQVTARNRLVRVGYPSKNKIPNRIVVALPDIYVELSRRRRLGAADRRPRPELIYRAVQMSHSKSIQRCQLIDSTTETSVEKKRHRDNCSLSNNC